MKYKLSDIMYIIGGGTPKTSISRYWGGNIPWLSVKDFNNDSRYVYSTEKSITEEGLSHSSTKLLQQKDTIISARGTVGEIAMIPYPMAFNQSCYGLRAKKEIIDSVFLYYLIKDNLNILKKRTHGTVFDTITKDTFSYIEVEIPNKEIQIKITNILEQIDDKIELNNRINENLQEQAQAIFKNWFIDFAPFGGTMPSDWKELSLADIADFINGYSYTSSELKESKLAMATIKNFDRNGRFKIDGYKELIPTKKIKTDQYIKLFDIIVAHTDLTQKAEIAGNAEIVLSKSKYEDIICSMDIVKVKPKCNISNFLIIQFLKDSNFKTHCLKYVNGTTVLHLSKKALPEYKICLPSDLSILSPIVNLFSEYYNSIANNTLENERLAELRDTLLPRLMSGEIDVSALKYKI